MRACAREIGCSTVTVCNLKKRYLLKGAGAFVNGHRGMKPKNKKYDDFFCEKIAALYRSKWERAPISAFHDALFSFYNIKIAYNTLLSLLRKKGIRPPRSWTTKEKKLHKPRAERPRAGELVQMDASTHDWFMSGELFALHGAIDDATHAVTGLYFCKNECRLGYNEVLRQTWHRYGVPRAYYTDRHSSFVKSKRKKGARLMERLEYSKDESTHFNDLCRELDIEVILALSAQAKGRIERLWQTLQGKLPYVFRHLGIRTAAAANDYVARWVSKFNEKYSVAPRVPAPAWRNLPAGFDEAYKLSVKFTCRTNSGGYFTFHDCEFRLAAKNRAFRKFELCLSERFGVRAYMNGQWHAVELSAPCLQDTVSDRMPAVEKELVARYLLSDLHADSA